MGAPSKVEDSSESSSGKRYLAVSTIATLFCLCYPFDHEARRGVAAAAGAALALILVQLTKISIRTAYTFILAAQSVVLTTLALGCAIETFPLFVAASTTVTAAQSFLCLPFRIIKSQ